MRTEGARGRPAPPFFFATGGCAHMELNSIEILMPEEKSVTINGERHPIHLLTYPEVRSFAKALVPLIDKVLTVRGGEAWNTQKMGSATLEAILNEGGDLIPGLVSACYPTLKDRQSDYPLQVTLQLFATAWAENNVFQAVADFFGRMKASSGLLKLIDGGTK